MPEVRRDFVAVLDESVRRFETSPPSVQAREALRTVASDLEACVKGTVSSQMRKRLYEWFEGWAELEAARRSARRVAFSERDSPSGYLSRLIGEALVASERADATDVVPAVLARLDPQGHELLLGYFLQGEVSQIANEHLRAAMNAVPAGVPDDDQVDGESQLYRVVVGDVSGEDDIDDQHRVESQQSSVVDTSSPEYEGDVGDQNDLEPQVSVVPRVPPVGPSVSVTARLGKASGGEKPQWYQQLMAQRMVGLEKRFYRDATFNDLTRAIENRERTGVNALRWADKYRAMRKALVESGARVVGDIPPEMLKRAMDTVKSMDTVGV